MIGGFSERDLFLTIHAVDLVSRKQRAYNTDVNEKARPSTAPEGEVTRACGEIGGGSGPLFAVDQHEVARRMKKVVSVQSSLFSDQLSVASEQITMTDH
jgi:hypothetical protein